MARYKLTDEDIVNIRILRAAGLSQQCVADKYDVTRATISEIDRGITRKAPRGTKLDMWRVMTIRQQLAAGMKQQYLADLHGVKQPTISQINTGAIWN